MSSTFLFFIQRRARLAAGAAAACVALLVLPSLAEAGEAESRTLFAQGRELRQAGKCAEATEAFRKALQTYPDGLGALRNIAECEEELGRFASARRSWWDLRLAVKQSQQTKYAGWDADAEAARARLAPRTPTIIVRVTGGSNAPVFVNGRPVDAQLLGTELEQDVGPIEVTIRDGSASEPKKTLTLVEGQKAQVELVSSVRIVEKPKDGPKEGPVDRTPPPPVDKGPDGLLIGGGVALGVAGLALVGFGAALGIEQAALSDVERVCPDLDAAQCQLGSQAANDALEAKSRGETAAMLVNVFAIAGGVSAATGVGLLIASVMRGDDTTKKDEAPVRVDVTAVPGHDLRLWLSGRF